MCARDGARALAVVVEDERRDEPLLVAVHREVVAHELLVEDVQDRLAGDVRDVGRALLRGAAERAQVEVAGRVAVEGHADVLEVHDLAGRFGAHDLDRVLVAEEVRALDGVVGVLGPVVVDGDRGVHPARRRNRMRPHGVDLAHDRDAAAGAGGGEGGALPGEAGADDEHVVGGHVLHSIGRDGRPPGPACEGFVLADAKRCGSAALSARRTCSIVTTPRSTPSASTAMSAPFVRRCSSPSSDSSGRSDAHAPALGLAGVDELARPRAPGARP